MFRALWQKHLFLRTFAWFGQITRASTVGGGGEDSDSELLKLVCCRRSLILVGQRGNWLKANTGRDQGGWAQVKIRKDKNEWRAVVGREYREI